MRVKSRAVYRCKQHCFRFHFRPHAWWCRVVRADDQRRGCATSLRAFTTDVMCARTGTAAHVCTRRFEPRFTRAQNVVPSVSRRRLPCSYTSHSSYAPLADDNNNTLLNQLLLHDTPFGLSAPHTSSSFNHRSALALESLTMKFTSTLAVVFAVCTYVAAIPLAQDPSKSEHIDGQSAQADDSTRPYSDC